MSIVSHKVNGIVIGQRKKDGFINGTAMCVAHGKDISDWLRTEETWQLAIALASDLDIKANSAKKPNSVKTRVSDVYPGLVVVKRGAPDTGGGTWLHEDLALQLAQWCNPMFAIQVSRWVKTLIKDAAVKKATRTEWQKNRQDGKVARRSFTDAIQDYIERHPELPIDSKTWAYANATDAVYKVVFGRTAKELMRDFVVATGEALRDAFDETELRHVDQVESMAMRLIDNRDEHPCRAVEEAEIRLLIPVSSRAMLK